MIHLFTPAGDAALAHAMARQPLLAFDFDGTLAPIVDHPDDAHIPEAVAQPLARLALRLPVAVVSGRALADVRGRLGFEPTYIIGNHGAEDGLDPVAAARRTRSLDGLRDKLSAHRTQLDAAGVLLEDKGQSIALHYRRSRQRGRARLLIAGLLSPPDPTLHVFAGKMVQNIVPAGAPDKAAAVHALVAESGAGSAFFAGDDVNDEPVFATAAPDWVTVRIGPPRAASRARFYLDSPQEVAQLLQRMLDRLPSANA